jgi:hypothetical protein
MNNDALVLHLLVALSKKGALASPAVLSRALELPQASVHASLARLDRQGLAYLSGGKARLSLAGFAVGASLAGPSCVGRDVVLVALSLVGAPASNGNEKRHRAA